MKGLKGRIQPAGSCFETPDLNNEHKRYKSTKTFDVKVGCKFVERSCTKQP